MQEHKCLRGGACLGISLEDLCKRNCTDQEIKKRNSGAQLWTSKSHVASAEDELQSLFCLCDCESPDSCSNTGITPPSVCPLSALDSSAHRNHSAFTTTNAWTDLLNTPDNVSYFMKNINGNPNEQIVILYNENILTKLFCRDSWADGITGRCINNNIEGAIAPDRSNTPNNTDCHDQSQRDVINKEQMDSSVCDDGHSGKTSGGIRRKSVSFADDVIVYLYDKDSPTDESRLESSSSLFSDILFDDNGLEWEDDFLALVKNCQSQSHPESQNWTVNKPKSLALPQSCLFLTHVNESDLEL